MFSSLKDKIKEYKNNAHESGIVVFNDAAVDVITKFLVREAKHHGLTISKANMKQFIIKTLAE